MPDLNEVRRKDSKSRQEDTGCLSLVRMCLINEVYWFMEKQARIRLGLNGLCFIVALSINAVFHCLGELELPAPKATLLQQVGKKRPGLA